MSLREWATVIARALAFGVRRTPSQRPAGASRDLAPLFREMLANRVAPILVYAPISSRAMYVVIPGLAIS